MSGLGRRLRAWAQALKRAIVVVHAAARDPRTPRTARLLALLVIAYALSPIDLVPDFIPILGQLDDLLLVPAGLWLALRFIPREVLEDAQRAADAQRPPARMAGAVLVVAIWVLGIACLALALAG